MSAAMVAEGGKGANAGRRRSLAPESFRTRAGSDMAVGQSARARRRSVMAPSTAGEAPSKRAAEGERPAAGSGRAKQQRPDSLVLLSGIDAASAAAAKKHVGIEKLRAAPLSPNPEGSVSLDDARRALRRASQSGAGSSDDAARASEKAAVLLKGRRKSVTPVSAENAAAAAAHATAAIDAHKKLTVAVRGSLPPTSKGSRIRAPGTPGMRGTPNKTPLRSRGDSMVRSPSATLREAVEQEKAANGDGSA